LKIGQDLTKLQPV